MLNRYSFTVRQVIFVLFLLFLLSSWARPLHTAVAQTTINPTWQEDHGHDSETSTAEADLTAALGPLIVGGMAGLIAAAGLAVWREKQFSLLQLLIVGFGVATAVIHLVIGFSGDWLLLLNGLGYLALTAAFVVPHPAVIPYRPLLTWGLIGYTIITITGYFITHGGHTDPLGLATKAIEFILILLLFGNLIHIIQTHQPNQPTN